MATLFMLCMGAPSAIGEDGSQAPSGQEQLGVGQASQIIPQAYQPAVPGSGSSSSLTGVPQSATNLQPFQPAVYTPEQLNVTSDKLNVTPQQLNLAPGQLNPPTTQGPPPGGLGFEPVNAAGLVAYKPIPDHLLPGAASPATQTTGTQSTTIPTMTNLGAPAINWGAYTLGPDDVIHIAVRNQPEFTGTFVIGHDGNVQFGFLGDVPADGLTKEELARRVEERLKRYVRVPAVHVTIVGFNSKAIYILGRVARPGKYAMRGDSIKIRDAVIAAGLVVQHAKLGKVYVVKSDPKKPSHRIVNLKHVLYKGKMKDNVELVNGDIVVIPTTIWGGITDFLNSLLSPTGHAGSVAALAAL